ncbi:podocalyxin [Monodelphis domestica]|uniref:podocalyxin n=1 Tax=Monodelphis domestica TaxID=13616 RepID=UPI0024E248FD|nr:podocalyxin [Monodelphis domestica]
MRSAPLPPPLLVVLLLLLGGLGNIKTSSSAVELPSSQTSTTLNPTQLSGSSGTENPKVDLPGASSPEKSSTGPTGASSPEKSSTGPTGASLPEKSSTGPTGASLPEKSSTGSPGASLPEKSSTGSPGASLPEKSSTGSPGATSSKPDSHSSSVPTKADQEVDSTTLVAGGSKTQTTGVPIKDTSSALDPLNKPTLASSTSSDTGTLRTKTSTFSAQVVKSSPSSSATTKETITSREIDASTLLTNHQSPLSVTTTSQISGSSLPVTSLDTSSRAQGAFPTITSPVITLTSRTQSTVVTTGGQAPGPSDGSGPVTSQGPATLTSMVSALVTPSVTPKGSTSVFSDDSTSSTISYSSHHQPPAMATSESETFESIPNKITCQPDSYATENLLILKMTNFTMCDSPKDSRNHPLYVALCRAGKVNFNKDRDVCHVQLVPQPEKQEVAILNVSVQTHLQPKELFEVLKKRWDDLKALGVSNMTYGKESLDKDEEDRFSLPLIITIVCMAAFLLLVAALYGCFHQRFSQRKDQQRLTEELQTVENGYHDNPTLEVMETSSEMQEKKVANLNGELGDSWIVPLDNLTKDDLDQEEEDTHL